MRLWKYFLIFLFLSSCTSNQDPKFIANNQLIIDTHIDTPYRLYNQLQENGSYEKKTLDLAINRSQIDLIKNK